MEILVSKIENKIKIEVVVFKLCFENIIKVLKIKKSPDRPQGLNSFHVKLRFSFHMNM